jgi:hypothetical protein
LPGNWSLYPELRGTAVSGRSTVGGGTLMTNLRGLEEEEEEEPGDLDAAFFVLSWYGDLQLPLLPANADMLSHWKERE